MDSLPSDLVLSEILARTSSEALSKCRMVRKEWNSETYSLGFIQENCLKTNSFWGYLIQSFQGKDAFIELVAPGKEAIHHTLSLDFLPRPVSITAADQGLVTCTSMDSLLRRTNYICKPTIRRWALIPDSRFRYEGRCSLKVLKEDPLHFKILQFSQEYGRPVPLGRGGMRQLMVKIFDSETWSWRQVAGIEFPKHEGFGFEPAIPIGNTFYWLTTEKRLFAYHLRQESWEFSPIPEFLFQDYARHGSYKLTTYQGKLAMFWINSEQHIELWTHCRGEWTRQNVGNTRPGYGTTVGFYTPDTLFEDGYQKVIFHNLLKDTKEIINLSRDKRYGVVLPFKTNWEGRESIFI